MEIEKNRLHLEEKAFKDFMNKFKKGKFGTQRLGQAFYDHFKLYRLVDQQKLQNIYAKDGEHAVNCIKSVFDFN